VLGDKRRPRETSPRSSISRPRRDDGRAVRRPAEALENSVEIAKRCNIELTLGKNFLPQISRRRRGHDARRLPGAEAKAGLESAPGQLFPDPRSASAAPGLRRAPQVETDTIIQMGFPGYFLIVADFINWGKNNGVPVGPGRGSGAGSLVAYSLGITDLDPLAYALLFERFLNPERVSMPDFDIDFCQDNRWRVIEYVREPTARTRSAQIATFGTMSSKAVIRDVGRVLDLPYNFCDRFPS
jgi:DNA polymerase-3 subunit alpha